MKSLFDELSLDCSTTTTRMYSTSFSLATRILDASIRGPIYSIYGFVRLADEIVDSFHEYQQEYLLDRFEKDCYEAIEHKISLNPILNSFQKIVHQYQIDHELIDAFFQSMRTDLYTQEHIQQSYESYIYGSAEVVGLMCLKVFTEGDQKVYDELTYAAKKLGAAFQKINFLRDLSSDYHDLNRQYFPKIDFLHFNNKDKSIIEKEIEQDFKDALPGIKSLPTKARLGVYIAYKYYYSLFKKIQKTPAQQILHSRIRVPNLIKYRILLFSFLQHKIQVA